MRFTSDGVWVTMRLHGLDRAPEVAGESATFDMVRGADEVTYEVTNRYLKENILLEQPPTTAPRYVYTIDASAGIIPTLTAQGVIEFRDATGDVPVVMPAAYMFDSAPDPALSTDVTYDLNKNGEAWTLTVTPNMAWLQDPGRVYPVTIDPSLGNEPASKDCWIRDTTPNGNNCGDASTYVKVGRSSGPVNYRGLIDFDTSAIPATATIDSAEVPLYLDHTQTTSTVFGDYAFFRAGSAFSGSSATWNTSGISGTWVGGDPGTTAYGTLSLNGSASGFRIFGGNLKDLVQNWVTNPTNKTGLVLKPVGTPTLNVLSFYSSAPAATNDNKRPRLNVTYTIANSPPHVPSELSITPVTASGETHDSPTVWARVADPDGPSTVEFRILDDAGSAVSISAGAPFVTFGQLVSVPIQPDLLSPLHEYRLDARGYDGALYSTWSTALTFTVGLSAPDVDAGQEWSSETYAMEEDVDSTGPATVAEQTSVMALSDDPGKLQDYEYVLPADEGTGATLKVNRMDPYTYDYEAQIWGACGITTDISKIVRIFKRAQNTSQWYNDKAYLNCGKYDGSGYGFNHILERHAYDWSAKARYVGSLQWRHAADFAMYGATAHPQYVRFNYVRQTYCLNRWVYIYNGETLVNKFKATVILGTTGRRIISAYPSKSWCSTTDSQTIVDMRP